MEHNRQKHWTTWTCPVSCQHSFDSTKELLRHIEKQHPETDTSEPGIIIEMSAIRKALSQPTNCPLCKETLESSNAYERHVGRHQIELSLFALPRKDEDDTVENDDSEQLSLDQPSEPMDNMSAADKDSRKDNLKSIHRRKMDKAAPKVKRLTYETIERENIVREARRVAGVQIEKPQREAQREEQEAMREQRMRLKARLNPKDPRKQREEDGRKGV